MSGATCSLNTSPHLAPHLFTQLGSTTSTSTWRARALSASLGFTSVIFLSVSRPKILQPAALPTLHSMPSCVSRANRLIDVLARGMNRCAGWLFVLCALFVTFDVLARKVLVDVVLPNWVKRCGAQCGAAFNAAIAPIAGVKYQGN